MGEAVLNTRGTPQPRLRDRSLASLLILPPLAWLILFVVAPTFILLIYSFCDRDEFGRVVYTFTLANYRQAFEPLYLEIFARSVGYAGITTLICIVAGYPVAFYIARSTPKKRDWLMLAVMIPFWTSFIIRTYAWITILSEHGFVSATLQTMRVMNSPLQILYTPAAVILGLSYTYLPFMILPIYAAAEKLDSALIEAALDLGAGPIRTFWWVILPMTWSGVAAGIVLVFVPSVAMFAVSTLLGGARTPMVGDVIERQFAAARNAPFGAALGMILLMLFAISFLILEWKKNGAADERR